MSVREQIQGDGLAQLAILIACSEECEKNGLESAKKMAERMKSGLPEKDATHESNEKI
jgi:hypothetical protein